VASHDVPDGGQPGGTITMAFTDIEGSTRLLQDLGDGYAAVLSEHHRLLRAAFAVHGGVERGSAGDGLYFVFPTARSAVLAVVEGQLAISAHAWPEGVAIRDRIGLHTGEPRTASEGYVGLDVHRAARICAAGHGGQILLSQTTRDLATDELRPPMGAIDLGIHRLKDVDAPERLFQVVGPGLERDFPAPRTKEAPRSNLTLEVTSFVGREREIEQAERILADAPLVTLTGPGGVGKTRLGLRLARVLLDSFEDGAWIVELGALSDPGLVLPAVVTTLGVGESAGRSLLTALVEHLRTKRLLLVLDDCDHMLAACAELAEALMRSCPGVRMVVTSREPLGVPGEVTQPIAPLMAPDVGGLADPRELEAFDACRLFIARARAVQPAFTVTERNAQSVAALPTVGRHPACARARRRAGESATGRADRGPPRRSVPALERRPGCGRAAPDAPGRDGLELRSPGRAGAGGPPPSVGLRWRRIARGGRDRLRRGPRRSGRGPGHPQPARRQVTHSLRSDVPGGTLPAPRDRPRVCVQPADGGGRGGRGVASAPGLVRRTRRRGRTGVLQGPGAG